MRRPTLLDPVRNPLLPTTRRVRPHRHGRAGLVLFFLPFGNDLLVVALTARNPDRFWLYAAAATAGSLLGCTLTDFVSRKIGEAGLEKLVGKGKLEHVQQRLKKHTFWALGAAALLPPPFPFTVFLIAASAIQISPAGVY